MIATTFEITAKRRPLPFGIADSKDFELRESGQMPAEDILSNAHITLYALDFEKGQAVFIVTAAQTT